MADLQLHQEFTIRLLPNELRLILKALGGRLNNDDIKQAKTLGDTLSLQKSTAGKHYAHENQKLIESLREAGLILGEDE